MCLVCKYFYKKKDREKKLDNRQVYYITDVFKKLVQKNTFNKI